MKRIPREKIKEAPNMWPEPAARVALGESIWVETERYNASNGPIYVEGIEPGDTLVVAVEDIVPVEVGWMNNGGPLRKRERVVIPVEKGVAKFPEGIEIPIEPMIGVIGVLPEATPDVLERVKTEDRGWRQVINSPPGKHGGNMDCKEIGIGSRVYLRAQLPGGMLGLADVHALQGNGELSGTGIELAADVRLRMEKSQDLSCEWPLVETDQEIMAVATARSYATASKEAFRALVDVVMKRYGLSFETANLIVCTIGDLRNCSVFMMNDGYLPDTEGKPPGDLTVGAAMHKLPKVWE